MKNTNLILVGLVALLIGGGVGFFAGTKYQQGKNVTSNPLAATVMGRNGAARRFGGNNGSVLRGEVLSKDSNSLTIKLPDGSTKIVILTNSTMVAKSTLGTMSDIANGNNVTVLGSMNSDGSVTAQDVQVGNLGVFGPRGSGTPSASAAPQGY